MIIENFTIAEFFGMIFIFPIFILFTLILFEGISNIINFFRFSDRRFRI